MQHGNSSPSCAFVTGQKNSTAKARHRSDLALSRGPVRRARPQAPYCALATGDYWRSAGRPSPSAGSVMTCLRRGTQLTFCSSVLEFIPSCRRRPEVVATRPCTWSSSRDLEWARCSGASPPMRMTASWFRSTPIDRIQVCGANFAPDGELPSFRFVVRSRPIIGAQKRKSALTENAPYKLKGPDP